MTELFLARCGLPNGAQETLAVALAADQAQPGSFAKVTFSAGADACSFALAAPVQDAEAAFAAELVLSDDERTRLAAAGLMGFSPKGAAGGVRLAAVRIVVRPPERSGHNTSEHPFFALYLDWEIDAATAAGSQFGAGSAQVEGEAAISLTLTTGFSAIHPPGEIASQLGARALQLRIDLDFMGASTGWFPLALIDRGFGLPDDIPDLRNWFRALVLPGFHPDWPAWNVDFPLAATLPLGVRFRESHLILLRQDGAYQIEALASGLVLEWEGTELFEAEDLAFSLTWQGGTYRFRAVVLAAQYPKARPAPGDVPRQSIGLPFCALEISAQAWRATLGMFASSAGGTTRLCPELVVEIAELEVASRFWNAGKPLYRSPAARLHLRGTTLLTCETAGLAGRSFRTEPGHQHRMLLFGEVAADNWLARYRDTRRPCVSRLSIAESDEDEAEADEDGPIRFVTGRFDPESHVLLVWRQDNDRLMEALRAAVPGLSRGDETDGGSEWLVGLELARFERAAGRDLQARLEWRKLAAPAIAIPSYVEATAGPPVPPPREVCASPTDGKIELALPQGAGALPAIEQADVRLALPLIDVAIAQPDARSLLFYRPAGEQPTLSLLNIYDGATTGTPRPILEASLDLSLSDGAAREPLPTQPPGESDPFLRLAFGTTASPKALAVVAWKSGEEPRILRALDGAGQPFQPLLPDPAVGEGPAQDCTCCPTAEPPTPAPLALSPDRFRTPNAGDPANGWLLSLQVAAKRALRSFLAADDGTDGLIDLEITKVCFAPSTGESGFLPPLRLHTTLTVRLSLDATDKAEKIEGQAIFEFDPGDMSFRLVEGGVLQFRRAVAATPDWAHKLEILGDPAKLFFAEELSLFGLKATFYKPLAEGPRPKSDVFLQLDLRGGRFALDLAPGVDAVVRYTDLGDDALAFVVTEFALGPGGLDLAADLVGSRLKVRGLSRPFMLEAATLRIVNSRMSRLSVKASGNLPELLSFAPVSFSLVFGQRAAGKPIELEDATLVVADSQKPILTKGVEYKFTLTEIRLRYLRDAAGGGGRHFFFDITGSAQFAPKPGRFDDGLLANLKTATVEFTRAPVCDEFTDHLTFLVELNEPVEFKIFDLFRMEIRSFGFKPKHDFPGGSPRAALIIGGQCEFAASGDVIAAEIDFHRMYLGLPGDDGILPQVDFNNLRVEIQAAEGFRIGGTVAVFNDNNRQGFKGDGFVEIPGLPHLGAAFGFMRLKDGAGRWKHAWFIAVAVGQVSYQIAPLPIYLRQVGLGFGFRMTSVMLREQPHDASLAELVNFLLEQLDQHQTLAREESWVEDVETDGSARWTVALEGVFTFGTSQADPLEYDAKEERKLRTVVLQIMAAMRSDLSMAAGAKMWFPVSYDEFLHDDLGMRARPLAKGFMHYSPRERRLIAYARKEKNAYYGKPDDDITMLAKTMLEPVPFEFVGVAGPDGVRGELGWADRLVFPLEIGMLKLECRGGILFAAEKGAIVYGYYFAARGALGLSGGAGGGSLGLRISAQARVHFAARLLMAVPVVKPWAANVYGQVGLDIAVTFSVHAWFKFKVGFVKVSLSVRFSFSVQIVIALEIGIASGARLGFKGRATVSISVFGRRLTAKVAVGLHDSAVDSARAKLRPYMSSMLDPGKLPPVPSLPAPGGAPGAVFAGALPVPPAADQPAANSLPAWDFAFSVVPLGAPPQSGKRFWLLWIMPSPASEAFYPIPGTGEAAWAKLDVPLRDGERLYALDENSKWVAHTQAACLVCHADTVFPAEDENGKPLDPPFTLRRALAGTYVPVEQPPPESDPFPFSFEGKQADLRAVDAGRFGKVVEDRRIGEGPRHLDPELNPTDPYDSALIAAIEQDQSEQPTEDYTEEQARASQGFLLRQFHDEISAYAEAFALEDGTPRSPLARGEDEEPPPSLPIGSTKATVWHSGMAVLLEADTLPDWARKPSDDGEAAAPERPSITFFIDRGADKSGGEPHTFTVRPLIDGEAARFDEGRVQLQARPIAYFDEELLALHWSLDWRGAKPDALPGVDASVDGHLRFYRVSLYALSGQADEPLLERHVLPADLQATINKRDAVDEKETVAIRPRYQFTIPVDEIFADVHADYGGQSLREVLAVVTPVAQTGEEADSFSIVVQQEPRLTPLPADEAEMVLLPLGQDDFDGECIWIEPPLPNSPGIASTNEWELIVRKLPEVSLGHYPQAQSAARAADNAARAVQPGDLIVRMKKHWLEKGHGENTDDGSTRYKLRLHAHLAGSLPSEQTAVATGGQPDPGGEEPRWLDHTGRRINAKDRELAYSFIGDRTPASAPNGHGWLLFLRARRAHPPGPDRIDRSTYSSVVQVRLTARVKVVEENGGKCIDRAAPATRPLPLPHLEWPKPVEPLAPSALRTTLGRLHVPLPRYGTGKVAYTPVPGNRRVLSTRWFGSSPRAAAWADFALWERCEDGLVNADYAANPPPQFGVVERELTRFAAIDAHVAAQVPASMVETQNWQCWAPAEASILDWLHTPQDRPSVPPDPRKAWYGWSDARLVWPSADFTNVEPPPGEPDVALRANLHAFLKALVKRMIFDWANPEGYVIELGHGMPGAAPSTGLAWLKSNSEGSDPYGWAALWHLGLAVELSAHDKTSGEPVPQAELIHRIEKAIAELEQAAGKSSSDGAEPALRDHLCLDLPLKPNDGLSAEESEADVPDLALDRVLISLRPFALPVRAYCVIEVPAVRRKARKSARLADTKVSVTALRIGPGASEQTFDWNSETIERDLGHLLTEAAGQTLLLKYSGDRRLLESALNRLGVKGAAYVDEPLSLTPKSEIREVRVWPHGRFAPEPVPAGDFDRFVEYLKKAPVKLEEGQSADPSARLGDEAAIAESYAGWARRFFAMSPYRPRSKAAFAEHNVATAALRSEAVDSLAPGRDGFYRHNALITWELATSRSRRVVATGRYDNLRAQMGLPAPAMPAAGAVHYTSYHVPRIRALEPPQLAGDRIVRDAEGRQHHELTFARHDEDARQRANSLLASRLEYLGMLLGFRREFRFREWGKRFSARMPTPTWTWSGEPDFAASDAEFLAVRPEARFGAQVAIVRCEPFFYETTLSAMTAAVAVKSPVVERGLRFADAVGTERAGADLLTVTLEPEWADSDIEALAQRWIAALPDDAGAFGRQALHVRVIFPRFVDSLPEADRANESGDGAVGTLPDLQASLQLTRSVRARDVSGLAAETIVLEEPLCTLRASETADKPFEKIVLAADVKVAEWDIDTSAWSDGVRLSLRLTGARTDIGVDMPSAAVARLPLSESAAGQLFVPENLPAWGALSPAAPLALRLKLAGSELRLVEPFALSRGAARPLGAIADAGQASPADLAMGIRLLADGERMAAAKAAAYRPGAAPPALLALIEQSAAVACRLSEDGIDPAVWAEWVAALTLWGWLDGTWQELSGDPPAGARCVIAAAPQLTVPARAAFEAFQDAWPLVDPHAPRIALDSLIEIDARAATLAQAAAPAFDAAWRWPEPGSIRAWVQRGNAPRVPWGENGNG